MFSYTRNEILGKIRLIPALINVTSVVGTMLEFTIVADNGESYDITNLDFSEALTRELPSENVELTVKFGDG